MDTTALYDDQVFKSYKELCHTINEVPKQNRAQRARHYEKLKYFFDFEHLSPQKIRILKVHNKGVFNKCIFSDKSDYINEITIILLGTLKADSSHQICLKKMDLYKFLGILNESYDTKLMIPEILCQINNTGSEQEKVSYLYINYVITELIATISIRIKNCLDILQKKKLINCNVAYKAKYVSGDIVPDNEAMRNIPLIERNVLNNMGFHNIDFPYGSQVQKEFYEKVRKQLLNLYKIETYHKELCIVLSGDNEITGYSDIPFFSQMAISDARAKLNQCIRLRLYEYMELKNIPKPHLDVIISHMMPNASDGITLG